MIVEHNQYNDILKNLLSFQTQFLKSGPTYSSQVVNPRHETP